MFLLLACTGTPSDDTSPETGGETSGQETASGPGTLVLSFQMEDDAIKSMQEPPVGTFRGSVYAEKDATAIGPVDGASSLFDVSVEDIDLSDNGGPTGPLYTSEPVDPQIVWILGCLDTDGNDCEAYDPITVPNENKLEVSAGTETPFTVYFGMLHPT